jgi:hypothetical protein
MTRKAQTSAQVAGMFAALALLVFTAAALAQSPGCCQAQHYHSREATHGAGRSADGDDQQRRDRA